MDRIAIISDVHGNLEAMKAVLKDIDKRGITKIYCLGDIISKGVNSLECLELIRKRCEIILRGNCEEFFSKNLDLDNFYGVEKERIIWMKSILTDEVKEYLLNLPFCHEFYMSGSLIRLFHASPNKIDGFIANLDNLETKKALFMPSDKTISQEIADVVIYGHTHTQFMDRLYNRTLVNAGSVGNPIDVIRNNEFDAKVQETTRANYLILEGNYGSKNYEEGLSIQFVKVPYDIEKELSSDKLNVEKDSYILEIKEARYRDMEKLRKSFESRNIDMNKF